MWAVFDRYINATHRREAPIQRRFASFKKARNIEHCYMSLGAKIDADGVSATMCINDGYTDNINIEHREATCIVLLGSSLEVTTGCAVRAM